MWSEKRILHLIIILLIFKPYCQILEIYLLKLKLGILLQHSLLETLKLTLNFVVLVGIQLLKAREEDLLTSLGLSQVISEPAKVEPNKNPSCIDLVITDQPNITLESGTRVLLDLYCHHHIIYCKVNFRIPPPSPLERKIIWHFYRANSTAINRSMTSFPWLQHLNLNTDPNCQVKTFTDIFLNIMSNSIPNETKKFIPHYPPWITKPLKPLLKRKNRLFKNYKKTWL